MSHSSTMSTLMCQGRDEDAKRHFLSAVELPASPSLDQRPAITPAQLNADLVFPRCARSVQHLVEAWTRLWCSIENRVAWAAHRRGQWASPDFITVDANQALPALTNVIYSGFNARALMERLTLMCVVSDAMTARGKRCAPTRRRVVLTAWVCPWTGTISLLPICTPIHSKWLHLVTPCHVTCYHQPCATTHHSPSMNCVGPSALALCVSNCAGTRWFACWVESLLTLVLLTPHMLSLSPG